MRAAARRLVPPAVLVLVACLSCQSAQRADIVFHNGIVWTGTDAPGVTAVAVAGERIVYAGADDGALRLRGAGTRVVDLEGRLLLPGLVDAHAHLHNLGAQLGEVSLVGTTSAGAVRERVLAAQAAAAPGAWIHGRGWDQNDWPATGFPTWRDLAGTDANPVYLDRVDGHAVWLNRAALDACGITRATPDPPGGRVVRDARGEPTGILIDNAEALVLAHLPEPTAEAIDANLRRAIRACNRVGLTGVHDAGTSAEVLASLRRIAAAGGLTLNVYAMLDSGEPAVMHAALRAGAGDEFGGRLVTRSVKLRADGALGSRGAALLAPYDDDPGNSGLAVTAPESLYAWTVAAIRHGFQPATHAIGDGANRMMLDIYERALAATGARDARPRIEHCQIVAVEDLPRFARLGVIASMQPTHATSDMPWAARRVGDARLRGAYAWRTLLASGAQLAFGSDAPVESIDPLWGIYAAVTRRDHNGDPRGGWLPGECVNVAEALSGFTAGAAYAAFDEADGGTIAVGKRADLTVIDRDILTGPPEAILDARVRMTVMRGEIVFDRAESGTED